MQGTVIQIFILYYHHRTVEGWKKQNKNKNKKNNNNNDDKRSDDLDKWNILVEITKNFDQVFIVGDRMINAIQDCKNFLFLRAFVSL